MRAKAWLVEQGHITKDGRGRMPLKSVKDGTAITTLLLTAAKSGVMFSDWPKGEVKVTKSEGDSAPKVKVVRSESNVKTVANITPYRFPEEEFEAYEFINGKRSPVSLRECCNTCGVSLVAHICDDPTYLNFRKVFIVPKG